MGRSSSRDPGKVTITEVAKHAGVSLATVSRALNGVRTVDPALVERVRASADALGYQANPLARSLVSGRTQTIAVVVPDLGNPTFQAVLRGLSRAAAAESYHVLIADSAEQVAAERELAGATRRRTDGLILCAPRMPEDELLALLPQVAPAVLVNRAAATAAPAVAADYGTALGALLDHLHGLGHRRFAYISGLARSASNAARLDAIAAFRRAHPETAVAELPSGVDFDSGAAAADAVLATDATAVLAFNDLVAMGLLSALTERGVSVPGDLSITGFDDIPFAPYTHPPLTTAAVPSVELGERAWAAMSGLLAGGPVPESVLLTPQITVRGSTGPVPA